MVTKKVVKKGVTKKPVKRSFIVALASARMDTQNRLSYWEGLSDNQLIVTTSNALKEMARRLMMT